MSWLAGVLLSGMLFLPPVNEPIQPPVISDTRGRMLMEIVDTLERDLERLGRQRREFNRQQQEQESKLARLQEKMSEVDRTLRQNRSKVEALLRSMVLMKEPDDMLLFFSTMRYHDLHVYRRVIRGVTTALSRRLSDLVEMRKKLERNQQVLDHQAQTMKARRNNLLVEIEQVEQMVQKTSSELKDRIRKIAAIESLFMTADFDTPYVEPSPRAAVLEVDGDESGNLEDYRRSGNLRIPISPGKLVKGFEEVPVPPYGTEKMVRGWLVVPFVKGKKAAATDKAFVRAPFGGRCVFVGEVPGFGLTVVLDHGYGYHTVYANLAILHIIKNDEVVREQTIATVQRLDPGSDALPYVYFELRENRIAVDPKGWFRLRPLAPTER